jgi:hypothetical protein
MSGHAYIGINENGLARAIVYDDPKWKKDTAKTIAEWIKMGRTIERLPVAEACDRLRRDWPACNPPAAEDTSKGSPT